MEKARPSKSESFSSRSTEFTPKHSSQWEAELHLKNSLAVSLPGSGISSAKDINNLPEELVVEIFRLALLDDHPRIRDLLLVSKGWHSFIVNTPCLWKTIQLVLRGHCIDRDIDAAEAYHTACIQRSGNMLLNIFIKAGTVCLTDEDGELLHDRLCAMLMSGGNEIRSQSEAIGGGETTNLTRWETFFLELPELWLQFDLLSSVFRLHAPNLVRIEIFEANDDDCFLPHFEEFIERTVVHSYVANTESLTRFCKPRFQYLRSLEITYTSRSQESDFKQLEDMTSLTTLTLRVLATLDAPLMLGRISLPHLAYLSLQDHIPNFVLESLHLPTLQRLTLIAERPFHLAEKFDAEPEELFWELPNPAHRISLNSEANDMLYKLLAKCHYAKTIKIPAEASAFVIDAIKNIPEEYGISIEVANQRTLDDNSLTLDITISRKLV